jgi:nitrate reductase gamma subunit
MYMTQGVLTENTHTPAAAAAAAAVAAAAAGLALFHTRRCEEAAAPLLTSSLQ